jgi:hypothetical protein
LEEQHALLEFGDVMMIDGTSSDDRLHWDVLLITVIHRNHRIPCSEVFCLGLQTFDVFLWMLRRIYAVPGDRCVTLLADEDSAMMAAGPQFVEESCANVRHSQCVFHKFRNLRKHIDHLTVSQPTTYRYSISRRLYAFRKRVPITPWRKCLVRFLDLHATSM